MATLSPLSYPVTQRRTSPPNPKVTLSAFQKACVLALLCIGAPGESTLQGAPEPTPAEGGLHYVFPLSPAKVFRAEIQLGAQGKASCTFKFADGKTQTLNGVTMAAEWRKPADKVTKKIPPAESLPDAAVAFTGGGLTFTLHTRPYLTRYTPAQRESLAKQWDTFPAASLRWISIELRPDTDGCDLWLEGRYCGRIKGGSQPVETAFTLQPGGHLRAPTFADRLPTGRFLPLDVGFIARPGVMQAGTVSLSHGIQEIAGIPMRVGRPEQNADVGVVREMQGLRSLETDENTSRTSLDGMPESLHFSVPQAWYHKAWVLCAVDSNPALEPVLTSRLTRFGISGRGEAMADTTMILPREGDSPGRGVQKVGDIEYVAGGGKTVKAPLYLVQVDLKTGNILDLLADSPDPFAPMKIGPYLDFEFLGRCGGLEVQTDHRRKPLSGAKSGVHVFGVTLEKAPVEMRLKSAQVGNIFHNDEKPETSVLLKGDRRGEYDLRYEITGIDGAVIATRRAAIAIDEPGKEVEVRLGLQMPELGWYGMNLTLQGQDGKILFAHRAAFALLGEDTRRAGYESPFGTWWFGGAHYSTRELKQVGPLLMKAGLRRTPVNWTKDTEADLAPWKFTLNQISWPFRRADLEDWPDAEARAEKLIREMLERFPHCQYIDLFHESFDNVLPPELYGGQYQPANEEREKQLFELGVKAARFIRAKFPQLKIIAGNHGGSAGTIAMLMRRGFPRELIDYLGTEAVGQTISPGKLSIHTTAGIWLLKETARQFGHDIPLAGCYEYTSRAERDLGPQRLAEWYMRDTLFGLAHRFPTISPGGIEDVGSCYYDTLYGAAGFCERNPLHYPKPAYVAMATLTKTLDSATLVRQVPTGSASVYVLEFVRGQEKIYAYWTARGTCDLALEWGADAPKYVRITGFFGQQKNIPTKDGGLHLSASTAVTYVVTSAAVTKIQCGRRSFLENEPRPDVQHVSFLEDLSVWTLGGREPKMETPERRAGQFALTRVEDPDKGSCLELELQPSGKLPAIIGEYASLHLKQPVLIPGQPHSLGVWIKGDSSWGRVYWELEDAKGERWISNAGYDGGDWAGQSTLDFDGWCFVTFPLTDKSPFVHLEPGKGAGQWRGNADGKLDYPLKLSGLFVETHRSALNLTDMQPVLGKIRIKEVSVLGK